MLGIASLSVRSKLRLRFPPRLDLSHREAMRSLTAWRKRSCHVTVQQLGRYFHFLIAGFQAKGRHHFLLQMCRSAVLTSRSISISRREMPTNATNMFSIFSKMINNAEECGGREFTWSKMRLKQDIRKLGNPSPPPRTLSIHRTLLLVQWMEEER
jgi:hypothetical protein